MLKNLFCLTSTLLLASVSAHAVIPEPGLWWNPSESGRGYAIELQDDRVFVAYYGYHPDGERSAFFTTFGTLNARTGVVTGYWAQTRNGQCFGCPYREPQIESLGNARLVFTSPTSGRIELPGVAPIPIQRQRLYGEHNHDRPVLKGVWTVAYGALGIHFGDVLMINRDDNSFVGAVAGHRVDAPSRRLLGRPTNDPSLPAVLLLLDSSATHYTAHAFDNSLGAWVGRTWTYPKTGALSGAGLPAFGNKLMGVNVASQVLSNTTADGELKIDFESRDAEIASASSSLAQGEGTHQVKLGETLYDMSSIRSAFEALELEMEMEK